MDPKANNPSIVKIIICIVVIICVIALCVYTPTRDYASEIIHFSWSGSTTALKIMDILLGILILCVGPFFAPKEPPTDGTSVSKLLYWKFMGDPKWRNIVLFLMLFALHFFVIAPFFLHEKEIAAVSQTNNTSNITSADFSLLESALGHDGWNALRNLGENAFNKQDFNLASNYFRLEFKECRPAPFEMSHKADAMDEPTFLVSCYRIDIINHKDPEESRITFETRLSNIKAKINDSIKYMYPNDAYRSYSNLNETLTNFHAASIMAAGENHFVNQVRDSIVDLIHHADTNRMVP